MLTLLMMALGALLPIAIVVWLVGGYLRLLWDADKLLPVESDCGVKCEDCCEQ